MNWSLRAVPTRTFNEWRTTSSSLPYRSDQQAPYRDRGVTPEVFQGTQNGLRAGVRIPRCKRFFLYLSWLSSLISQPKLTHRALILLADNSSALSALYLSVLSSWEIKIKAGAGRLVLSGTTCGICDPRDAIHIPKTADITYFGALAVGCRIITETPLTRCLWPRRLWNR